MKTAFISLFIIGVLPHCRADIAYDFDALSIGLLADQGGWEKFPYVNSLEVKLGSGVNPTKIVELNGGRAIKKYSTRFFTNIEGIGILQFNAKPNGVQMTLGSDGNKSGMVGENNGELGPLFGFDSSSNFFITPKSANGAFASSLTRPLATANGGVSAGTTNDWYQIRLEIDFASDTGCLFYKNLTVGQTEFTPVMGLQNVPLNLQSMGSGSKYSDWDTIYLRANGGGQIDNIRVASDELQNSGFESNLDQWTISPNDIANNFSQLTSEASFTGAKSLKIVKTGYNAQGSSITSRRFRVENGKNYKVSFWSKKTASNGGNVGVYVRYYNANNTELSGGPYYTSVADGPDWTRGVVNTVMATGATSLEVWIHATTGGAVTCYLDDVTVYEDLPLISGISNEAATNQIAQILSSEPSGMTTAAIVKAAANQPALSGIVAAAANLPSLPTLPEIDTKYLDFSKTGNRSTYDEVWQKLHQRLRGLVLAECIQDQGGFMPMIEETLAVFFGMKTWLASAHDNSLENYRQNLVEVDLYAAINASALATTDWLLGSKLATGTRAKILQQTQNRVFTPYLNSVRSGSTTGTITDWWRNVDSNWNATGHAHVTGAALTLIPDRAIRAEYIAAAEVGIDKYLDGICTDGYSNEGLAYGQNSLGDYQLLSEAIKKATNSNPAHNLYSKPKVFELARFPLRMKIINNLFPSFGDCNLATTPVRWISEISNLRFGWGITDLSSATIVDLGDRLYTATVILSLNKQDAAVYTPTTPPEAFNGIRDWFPQAGVLISRPSSINGNRLGLAVKGASSSVNSGHAHSDAGSFVVSKGTQNLILDPGSPLYNASTFGPGRFDNPMVSSEGHSVPKVAGLNQKNTFSPTALISCASNTQADIVTINLKDRYDVPSLISLNRTIEHQRVGDGVVVVTDQVQFNTAQTFESALITTSGWQMISPTEMQIYQGEDKIRIIINTGGQDFTVSGEALVGGTASCKRLRIQLNSPVTAATITLKITPIP